VARFGERGAGIAALVGVTALWGISFPLVEDVVAGRGLGEILYFLFLRFGVATLAFLPVAGRLARASRVGGLRAWGLALFIGLLFFCGFYLQSWGLKHTDASRSAFVTVLSVPMVPLLAAALARRAPSRRHLIGSLAATAGIALVLAPGGEIAPNRGDWLTLASASFFAVEIVALGYVARRAPVIVVAVGQILGVALIAGLGLLVLGVETPAEWPGLGRGVWITGLLCTTLALGAMTWGQARVRPEMAAVIFALEPVFASLFVWLLGDRGLGPWQAVGGLVVFLSVAWTARGEVAAELRARREGAGAVRVP